MVVNSVLKLSYFFCAYGFLLHRLESSIKMPVFNTRLYSDDMICYW